MQEVDWHIGGSIPCRIEYVNHHVAISYAMLSFACFCIVCHLVSRCKLGSLSPSISNLSRTISSSQRLDTFSSFGTFPSVLHNNRHPITQPPNITFSNHIHRTLCRARPSTNTP